MAQIETYAVNFANGNMHPHVNLRGWPDMTESPQAAGVTEVWPDPEGRNMRFTRGFVPPDLPKGNGVFVVPPAGSLTLDSRFLMRVTFDLPLGEGLSLADHGEFDPVVGLPTEEASPTPGGHHDASIGDAPVEANPPAAQPGSQLSVVEPWAVVLIAKFGGADLLTTDLTSPVSCQFNRRMNGIRLNAPVPNWQTEGPLQDDQSTPIEGPLFYPKYQQNHFTSEPGGVEGVFSPPVFTLDHAFCGFGAEVNKHAAASGSLEIQYAWGRRLTELRVFSTNALIGDPDTPIGALGVSVMTLNGIGRVSARLRTFTVWFSEVAT